MAVSIFRAAVAASSPGAAIARAVGLTSDCLLTVLGNPYYVAGNRVCIVGAGKAAVGMATALVAILKPVPGLAIYGHIVTKYGHNDTGSGVVPGSDVRIGEAGHPTPDLNSVTNARAILDVVSAVPDDELIVVLLSGGGSSLLTLPAPGLALEDVCAVNDNLLRSGATIQELNTVRKHLSSISGGRLAAAGSRGRMIALALSDVIGDDLHVIASGPTVGDPTCIDDARAVMTKYGLPLPAAVEALWSSGSESPKPGDPLLARCSTHVIGSNHLAIQAASAAAIEQGYTPVVVSEPMSGEASVMAQRLVARALAEFTARKSPIALLAGGETTVTVRNMLGKGGRNQVQQLWPTDFVDLHLVLERAHVCVQEMALAAAIALDGCDNCVFLSCGTDGTDGPTDATGAVVDGQTVSRGEAIGLSAASALAQNDSYTFFHALSDGSHVITGPTGTNVMDVAIVLCK